MVSRLKPAPHRHPGPAAKLLDPDSALRILTARLTPPGPKLVEALLNLVAVEHRQGVAEKADRYWTSVELDEREQRLQGEQLRLFGGA
ncbi:MAG: hypothetical protein AAF962_03140 [Actinomycetota bacterium]